MKLFSKIGIRKIKFEINLKIEFHKAKVLMRYL